MQVFWGEARKGTVGVRNCKVDGETGHKIDTHNSLPPQLRWWPMNVNDAGASSVGKKRKQNGHKTLLIKQIKTVLLLAIEAQEGERSNIRKEKKPSLQEICASHRVRREEKFDGLERGRSSRGMRATHPFLFVRCSIPTVCCSLDAQFPYVPQLRHFHWMRSFGSDPQLRVQRKTPNARGQS